MSDFKDKMNQIRFPVGLRPRGAYSAPPDPLAVFKESISNGRTGGREEDGRTGKGKALKKG